MLRRLLRDAKDLRTRSSSAIASAKSLSLHKSLQKHGFSVGALHGDMDQSARTAALDQFRKGEIPLLVASDVAARGLDIPAVSHVFNFDVPHHADDYVHRIGRTGRAGRAGTAISIVTPLDTKSMAAIEKLIGQSIPRAEGDFATQLRSSDDADSRARSRGRQSPQGRFATRRARGIARRAASRGANVSRDPPTARPRTAPCQGRPPRCRPAVPPKPSTPPVRCAGLARAFDRPPRAAPAQREVESEPADHSHLPAFLLAAGSRPRLTPPEPRPVDPDLPGRSLLLR